MEGKNDMTVRKLKRKGDSLLRDALILCVIALVLGSVVGIVYMMTRTPIDNSAEAAKNEAYIRTYPNQEVIPVDDKALQKIIKENGITGNSDEKIIVSDGVIIKDKAGKKIGYSFIAAAKGYNGNVTVSVGIDIDGVITGIDIVSMNETEGIGAKCTEDSFKEQFIGKSGIIKKGSDIDAISGATLTTDAVVSAVNACLELVDKM